MLCMILVQTLMINKCYHSAHRVFHVAEGLQLSRHEQGVRELQAPCVAGGVRRRGDVVLWPDHDPG